MIELSKPVYIPSIEGSDIYNHMFRGRDIEFKYIGMIPSSLELNKLINTGLKTFKRKTNDKLLSTDIINVKFKQKVTSGKEVVKRLKNKIGKLHENKNEYKQKLIDLISTIESEIKEDKWNGLSSNELRKQLYSNGFRHHGVDYVVYKRSSAKSRIGQCLFIKKELYEPMIRWSRLGIEFRNRDNEYEIDFPSLLAYESLVGSSIESVINIHPDNILIVDDVESKFKTKSNVIRTGESGFLESFKENVVIKNSLFDGESLLDEKYFPEGKSMILLRNHMFKSAAFNTNIQKFLRENCPQDIDYDKWEIQSMFKKEKVLAKNVHLIITPSSLKALKFSKLLGTTLQMWRHWKNTIIQDGCVFGVCKSEKESKFGYDDNGKVVQQTSYQMINSLPLTKTDIEKFTIFEKKFIEKLKNDDRFFMSFIRKNANDVNCNEMFADLYEVNDEIVHTKIFRKFRKEIISSHVTHVKNGKVRLVGDYCVMLGNPMEFLYHAIGKVNKENPQSVSLFNNEVYTKMFGDVELTGFRNPHTSPSNVLLVKNKKNKDIDNYFNLSQNIVCVNAIQFPLQDILSGSDYDSDTVLLIKDNHLLKINKSLIGKYDICVNQVKSSKKQYNVCNEDMAIIDCELSNSQKYIGRTVNVGQLCMSRYWDLIHEGKSENDLSDLMKKIDVVTVLSGICIDLAKKMFDININKEIEHINRTKELKIEKPLFWKYVSQDGNIKTTKYNCPMDFLFDEMTYLNPADYRKDIEFEKLLVKLGTRGYIFEQEQKILSYVENMVSKINNTYASNITDEEKDRRVDDAIKYCKFYVEKLNVNKETMYSLLSKLSNDSIRKNMREKIATRLMEVLYSTQKSVFLGAFLKKTLVIE